MLKKILSVTIIGIFLSVANGMCGLDENGSGMPFVTQQSPPTYQYDYFNYPHPLPPDYVYRTSRVFPPPPTSHIAPAGAEAKQAASAGLLEPAAGEKLAQGISILSKQLLENAKEEIDDSYGLMVTTFVNLNRLYSTSSLGRYISEQMISELQFAGINIIDVRKTPALMISEGHGEYGLSRDMDELSFVQPVQAMVVGTYTVAEGKIFINARVLRNEDGMVLSAAQLSLDADAVVARLLADEGMPVGPGKALQVRAFNDK